MMSCTDEDPGYNFDTDVDVEVQPFMLSFQEEASLRGLDLDWDDFEVGVQLVDIETNAVGRCLTYSNQSRIIELDESYWSAQSDLDKEFVIFHELGHCILERAHLDEADTGGTCISIMHSDDIVCRNGYNLSTRESYLDELFQ